MSQKQRKQSNRGALAGQFRHSQDAADAVGGSRLRKVILAPMEFGSAVLNAIGAFCNAADDAALRGKAADLRGRFEQIESVLGSGPYFEGSRFSLVDAVFGPIFRYFDGYESFEDFDFFTHAARVTAWRRALAARPSVKGAAHEDYGDLLRQFLLRRNNAISRHVERHAELQP